MTAGFSTISRSFPAILIGWLLLCRLAVSHFTGPAVPDAIFRDAARGQFEGVLAVYRDHG